MRSFKSLTPEEKVVYICILFLYPLILLYEQMGKSVWFLNSRKRQITASILTVCLMLSMIPLSAVTAYGTSANTQLNIYPYVDSITQSPSYGSMTLALDESGSSYQWQVGNSKGGEFDDVSGETGATFTFDTVDGKWYRCVIDGSKITMPVQVLKSSNSRNNFYRVGSDYYWYLSNDVLAYSIGGSEGFFDIVGKFDNEWICTSYDACWDVDASQNSTPSSIGTSSFNSEGVEEIKITFDPDNERKALFSIDLADGYRSLSVGTDTMLYEFDKCPLTAKEYRDGKLRQIQMVGASSLETATSSDSAFVISPVTAPSSYWIGYWSSRRGYTYNNAPSSSSTIVYTFDRTGTYVTQINNGDSGMTMSWTDLPSGGMVQFEMSVGTVQQTGAILNDPVADTDTIELVVSTGSYYRLVDQNGQPATEWKLPDSEGNITFDSLVFDTLYTVETVPVDLYNNGNPDDNDIDWLDEIYTKIPIENTTTNHQDVKVTAYCVSAQFENLNFDDYNYYINAGLSSESVPSSGFVSGLELLTSYSLTAEDKLTYNTSTVATFTTVDHNYEIEIKHDAPDTLVSTCSGKECGISEQLKIAAPTLNVYNGAGNAQATLSRASLAGVSSLPTVKYVGRGNTSYSESESAPVNAGTYTASITVGDKTASVDYEIAKAEPSVVWPSGLSANVGVKLSSIDLSSYTNGGLGSFEWDNGDLAVAYGSSHEYLLKYIPNDSNYKAVDKDIKVEGVDNIAPTGQITIGENGWLKFWNTVTFGLFCKDYAEITIVGSDSQTDVKAIEYYISDSAVSYEDIDDILSWEAYTQKIRIDAERKVFVYAKITDNADNVTYISVDGGVVVFKDTEVTTGEYEYTLTTKTDIVTDIKPGSNTVNMIDICEPGRNARDMLDYFINSDGYIVFKGESLEGFTRDWYAGDYTVTVMYNALGEEYVEGTSKGDKITDTVITLTVHKADGKVDIHSDISKTYDGVKADVPIYNKLGTGEVIVEYKVKGSDDSTYTTTAPKDAGDYTVRVTAAGDNTYKEAFATADFTIAKANFTAVVEQEGSLIYNGDEQSAAVKATESVVTAEVTYKYGLTENECNSATVPAFKNADTYTVYYTASCPNFNDCKGSFTVTVEKKELTVTANNHSITYGDAPDNDGVTYSGFVNGETDTVLIGTLGYVYSYAQYDDVGDTYTITPKGLTAVNYEITFVPGKLTVNARPLVNGDFTVITDGYIYTGLEKEPDVSTTTSLVSAIDYTVAYENNINAGENTAKIVITGKNNASGTVYIYFSIGKADPQVTWPFASVGNAGDKLSTVALKNGFTWDNGDTVIVYNDNYYGMTYTPTDTNNYNILRKDIRVNGLDVTFPTGEITLKDNKWNEFLNNITFGIFFKETQSITITAADTESGVKEIAYYLANEELSIDDVNAIQNSKWTVYTDAFNVDPDNKYVVYSRITDKAGNVLYINSEGVVLDSVKPVIAGVEDGKDVYGDAIFTVDDTYLDNVTLDGKPVVAVDGKYSIPADNKEHTIVATDKTGNTVTYKLTVYKLYKVSFVVDGKEISTLEVGYGKDATLPEIPAKNGYTARWDMDGKNVASNTVITAVYDKIPQSPQTGDTSNIWLWVAVLFVSGFSMLSAISSKKRSKKS